ncbi:malate permease [Williamsoniiplasma somnilux]|uniref:Malate permease n=1 Tax=Williamsoniiplasma somnilux TaxID=215578 RepID=A0A2K8NX67_9MOLU|nr:AEC family transporter [Williamsoniiplasma somnilux]ATZ18432.1 malate permease [Williamsoniiplasma somnilux]
MHILLTNQTSEAIQKILGGWPLWTAIFATIFVIGLGFFLTKKQILNKDWEKVFIKIVMVVGLPALALQGFLTDASEDSLKKELVVILIGFLFYLLMTTTSKFIFYKQNKDVRDTLAMCIALGSTTFFGIPLITALAGGVLDDAAKITANNFNIPYRIFLYTIGFSIMSRPNTETVKSLVSSKKIKLAIANNTGEFTEQDLLNYKEVKMKNLKKGLKSIFLNPIIIATFIGFFIWATQLIPGIKFVTYESGDQATYFSVLRIDLLFSPFKKIIDTLSAICTPLAWVAIGMTIAKGDVKKAIKSKTIWIATFIRVIVVPLVALLMVLAIAGIIYGIDPNSTMRLTKTQLAVILIMAATPPANVVVAYAINYNKEPELASNLTTLSTVAAIVTMPIWVVVGVAIGSTPLFA